MGDWVKFGDAQTAQLDKANGRTADTLEIVENCEKRDAAAIRHVSRRWYEFWK